jgi:hypothetical protein
MKEFVAYSIRTNRYLFVHKEKKYLKSEADNIIILRVLDPLVRVWEGATVAVTEETGTSETRPLSSQTEDGMTSSQRNSVNMLNYMSMLTRKVDVNRRA